MKWNEAQEWERKWWGDCANTFNEEAKQYVYARHMGLDEYKTNWYGRCGWDFGNMGIMDIGSGPASILLKSKAKRRIVVDPCRFPAWVSARYFECGIEFWQMSGELIFQSEHVDLALIYNCLQHAKSPSIIIDNVRRIAKELRIFEWIDTGTSEGHLHNLTEENLNKWIGGEGKVSEINEYPCKGKAYFGVFPS